MEEEIPELINVEEEFLECDEDDKLKLIENVPTLATQGFMTMIGVWTENVTYCKRYEKKFESVIQINGKSCYLNFEEDEEYKLLKANEVEHSLQSCISKYN